jgi:hypothetical protein
MAKADVQDVQAAMDACVAVGWMEKASPGLYRLTPKGEQFVEGMNAVKANRGKGGRRTKKAARDTATDRSLTPEHRALYSRSTMGDDKRKSGGGR